MAPSTFKWRMAVHKLTPGARLGGPIFEGVDKDITLWADDEGRTSWMERFVDYLKAHGHLKDLSFMSFEHYPFMINGFSPPKRLGEPLHGTGNHEARPAHVA